MEGVLEGVRRRTDSPIAEIAALFHDLGKLNPNFQPKVKPNFQPKLDNSTMSGYSHHAYLSAHVFLCFCKTNPQVLSQHLGLSKPAHLFSVLTQIAHHHGNLSNMTTILSEGERERLKDFLVSEPLLPVSEYLQQWLLHSHFDALDTKFSKVVDEFWRMKDKYLATVTDKLDFFLDTQFGFACLIESDKRDAGDNKWFQRDEQLAWAGTHFTPALNKTLNELSGNSPLNLARTAIRKEALSNLRTALMQGNRTFELTAPTGSGKTFAMIAIADAIRQYAANAVKPNDADYSVVYALPFLTITEQVEGVCRDNIFAENPSFVTRLDSRAQDAELEALLAATEEIPDKSKELLQRSFSRDTWDSAFIITTFVQLFETLLSNRGATLLRLPNFAKCIFLLDEIQTLPPRLYVFFTAYLQTFCAKYDCYAILSTATMPVLEFPDTLTKAKENPRLLFPDYVPPVQLLDHAKYYSLPVFDRYVITRIDEDIPNFSLDNLAVTIRRRDASCLIILNTIEDTRRLYEQLCNTKQCEDVVLLNTHFTLDDRRAKIAHCKQRLDSGAKIILISTQLIEAGVDIDFPTVYRDMCPLPSLIQSAGRCNRNGKLVKGSVFFFELHGENNKTRAELVYRDRADRWILEFSRKQIRGTITESGLLQVQTAYFQHINDNLAIGDHPLMANGERKEDNLICRINEAAFEVVGSFRLIDEDAFGEEFRYYVSSGDDDLAWDDLKARRREFAIAIADAQKAEIPLSFADSKRYQIAIEAQFRQMSSRVVQVRVRGKAEPLPVETKRNGETEILYGLRKLLAPERDYSSHTGIDLNRSIAAIL